MTVKNNLTKILKRDINNNIIVNKENNIMKTKELLVDLEELRILDNELYVSQCKLSKFNLLDVDGAPPSQEQLRYRDIVNNLRLKVSKLLERETIDKHLSN
tara:strand:+ start:485 stop:787 length:303 start_codon:yes stop_codon:yes gene_type:complete